MPFIQFKNGFVRLYHDPRLSPSERNKILEDLKSTPDLLVGVRFYEDEKRILKSYYEDHIGTEEITAFRAYPASVLTETKPGDETSRKKQACLILVAVTGPNHLNELTDEGDIGIVGCYPLSVQPYGRGDHNNVVPFTLKSAISYRQSGGYQEGKHLRDFIASTPLEFQYTMNGVPPYHKEGDPLITGGEISEVLTSPIDFINRLRDLLQAKVTTDIQFPLDESAFLTFTELSELTRDLNLDLDGDSLARLFHKATNGE